MKPLLLACVFLTGTLFTSSAQAADAEITIRVMEIHENNPDAVMRVINLPDEAQLQQTQQLNTDTEQTQLQLREMEMQQERMQQHQQMEIEAQHNQQLPEHMIEQGNNSLQAPDVNNGPLNQGH